MAPKSFIRPDAGSQRRSRRLQTRIGEGLRPTAGRPTRPARPATVADAPGLSPSSLLPPAPAPVLLPAAPALHAVQVHPQQWSSGVCQCSGLSSDHIWSSGGAMDFATAADAAPDVHDGAAPLCHGPGGPRAGGVPEEPAEDDGRVSV